MITARDLEVRAGARLLLANASFQVAAGDKIGLVGRNGAGKTTLTKILAGEAQPAAGTVVRSGSVGYLPQDPGRGTWRCWPRTGSWPRAAWTPSSPGCAAPSWPWPTTPTTSATPR